ncbi:hypothetical protein BDFB_009108 [Asbolus verrucosus]|uniref:Uncharacterized protein n=1 Tax=Asbolus verrucosus TaxID=1661398 RepID=A0A482VW76_ASBVE|nr:hypothetical protein BDFB_009108 [Asbolus verrucosus]
MLRYITTSKLDLTMCGLLLSQDLVPHGRKNSCGYWQTI